MRGPPPIPPAGDLPLVPAGGGVFPPTPRPARGSGVVGHRWARPDLPGHALAGDGPARVQPATGPAWAVRRHELQLPAPAAGGHGTVIAYGQYGRPVLVFPSEGGSAWDYAEHGMVDAVRWLLDAGRDEEWNGR